MRDEEGSAKSGMLLVTARVSKRLHAVAMQEKAAIELVQEQPTPPVWPFGDLGCRQKGAASYRMRSIEVATGQMATASSRPVERATATTFPYCPAETAMAWSDDGGANMLSE
ncbi:hypothetical protein [Bradyrhizobium sp. UFLA05-112]